jgi:hypothetical protein
MMLCGTFWRKALIVSALFQNLATALGQDSAGIVQSMLCDSGQMFHNLLVAR